MIWAIILAAGESTRVGRSKLLLPFGEKTVIETVIKNSVLSDVEATLVVLGAEKERMADAIGGYPITITVNDRFREGMLSSIQCGFDALPEHARAALVMLGDQPLIQYPVINTLIVAYKQTGKGIVLPVHNRKRGHPILVDMKYRNAVRRLNPDIGLRELLHERAEDILEIQVNTPSILSDIDTVEDYNEQLNYGRHT